MVSATHGWRRPCSDVWEAKHHYSGGSSTVPHRGDNAQGVQVECGETAAGWDHRASVPYSGQIQACAPPITVH
ncbi:uncharacterized protein SPSK_03814 [Sporothrix schenckii 1099-18]|uniref:Uncharacterized protein n=1 Tax=Sporothrix schenckii 1099-18 TaxID=1397361 RepID=A0A0F2LZU1_SPOSC|nr:uncharacterized protein SPSK_03814 [Sporothrix schenckii 1099-18]KJR82015.1 hypothetical protein SPSK_03814 [Sporothrix schenckii 1099-18]